jgi:hypothetical protein
VLVIQTAKQGVTAQQIMAIIPSEIRATVNLYLDGKIRQWYSRGDGKGVIFLVDAKDRGRGTSPYGNTAAREGTVVGSRVHSRRTLDAAEGIDAPRSAAVTFLAIALLQEGNSSSKIQFGSSKGLFRAVSHHRRDETRGSYSSS